MYKPKRSDIHVVGSPPAFVTLSLYDNTSPTYKNRGPFDSSKVFGLLYKTPIITTAEEAGTRLLAEIDIPKFAREEGFSGELDHLRPYVDRTLPTLKEPAEV